MKNIGRITAVILLIVIAAQCAVTAVTVNNVNSYGDLYSGMYVTNVQILNGTAFIATNNAIMTTADLRNVSYPKELQTETTYGTEENYDMRAFDGMVFFNRGTVCTTDGVNFTKTKLDGKSDFGKIYDIDYYNGFFIGKSVDNKGNRGIATSKNGIDWSRRVALGSSYDDIFELFVFNNTLWIGDYDAEFNKVYYKTTDGVNFSKFTQTYGELFLQYQEDFLIFQRVDDYTSDSGRSYYVSNDGANWRVLMQDGKKMQDVEHLYIDIEYRRRELEVLDNAMPGSKPMYLKDYDDSKVSYGYNGYDGTKPPVTELSVVRSGKTTVLKEGLHPNAQVSAVYETEYGGWSSLSGAIYRSYDGINYSYFIGDVLLQDAASDGKGNFVISGAKGAIILGSMKKTGADFDITLEQASFNPDNSGVKMIKYVNGQYVICTFAGAVYTSPNGRDWTGVAAMETALSDVIYYGNKYYAAGNGGVYSSADLKNWSRVYESISPMKSLCIGNGKIMASGSGTVIVYSTDGVKWNECELPKEVYGTFFGVAYGGGVYVAAGGTGWGGSGVVLRSTDGVKWTVVSDGKEGYDAGTNDDVCYANCTYALTYTSGKFIATGLNRASSGFYMTSTDGLKWKREYTSWGLDLFSPLTNVVCYLDSYSMKIYDYGGGEAGETTLNIVRGSYAVLRPANRITPLFTASESYSATSVE